MESRRTFINTWYIIVLECKGMKKIFVEKDYNIKELEYLREK